MDKEIMITRSSMPDFEEYTAEIRELWDSRWLTNMGVKHVQFQKELERYLKVKHIELLTNGHMALELGIQALGLTTGEVITTPFTFASTTHAIVRNGLTPVFCDINPDDYTMDVSQIEDLITDRTVAILPVHVYGNICQVEMIDEIAKKHHLKVIYDAAHTFGETYKGNAVASFGDISCMSFHATKVFNTVEGGAVCYTDEEFGRRLYSLKNFGIWDSETVESVGANAKMNEFCAAMGICNLRHIEEEIDKRRLVDERYRKNLTDVVGVRLNIRQEGVKTNYAYFPVEIDEDLYGRNRDEVQKMLAEEGVYARKYFYPLTSEYECYRDKYDSIKTPVAKGVSRRIITLPIYADLALNDVDRICDKIIRFKING